MGWSSAFGNSEPCSRWINSKHRSLTLREDGGCAGADVVDNGFAALGHKADAHVGSYRGSRLSANVLVSVRPGEQ